MTQVFQDSVVKETRSRLEELKESFPTITVHEENESVER